MQTMLSHIYFHSFIRDWVELFPEKCRQAEPSGVFDSMSVSCFWFALYPLHASGSVTALSKYSNFNFYAYLEISNIRVNSSLLTNGSQSAPIF